MPRTIITISFTFLLQLSFLAIAPASFTASVPDTGTSTANSVSHPNTDDIRMLIESGKLDEASLRLNKVLNRTTEPEEKVAFKAILIQLADAFYTAAEKASNDMKFTEAISNYKQSLELNSTVDDRSRNKQILFNLISIAENEEKLHDDSAALKSYSNLIDMAEDNSTLMAALLYSRGKLLYGMSRSSKALKDLTRAISIYTTQADSVENYEDCIKVSALILIDLYRYDEGERELLKLLNAQQSRKNEISDKRVVNTMVQLATLKQKQFKFSEAEQLFKQALALQVRLYPTVPENCVYITQSLGYFYQSTGRFLEAETEFKKNCAVYENKPQERSEYAKMLNNLANHYQYVRRYNDALSLRKSALEIRESLFGSNSLEAILTRQSIANLYRYAGRYKESEDLFHKLLGETAQLQGVQSPTYGDMLDDMAQLYNVWEKTSKAEIKSRGALENAINLHGEASYDTVSFRETLVYILSNLGRFEEAEKHARKNIAITENLFGIQNPKYAARLRTLGMILRKAERFDEAMAVYHEAMGISEQVYGTVNLNVMADRYWLGRFFVLKGEHTKAEEQYKLVLKSYEKAYGTENDNLSSTLDNLAFLYMNDGRFNAAYKTIKRLYEIRNLTYGKESPENDFNTLAVFQRRTGNHAGAEKIYLRDLKQNENNFGAGSKSAANTNNNLAWLYYNMKDYNRAEQLARKALASYTAHYGRDNTTFSGAITVLGLACTQNNKFEEAEQLFQRAIKLYKGTGLEDGFSQMGLGELYLKQKRYTDALPLLLEGLRISVRENEFELKWSCLNDISVLMEQQAHTDAALFFAKQTIHTIQKSMGDIAQIGTEELGFFQKIAKPVYTRLANLLEKNGDKVRSHQVLSLLKLTHKNVSSDSDSLFTTRESDFETALEKRLQVLTAIIQQRKTLAAKSDRITEESNRLVVIDKEVHEATTAYNQLIATITAHNDRVK